LAKHYKPLRFPLGSILTAVVEDYISSLAGHGFKNIVIYVSHGGNEESVKKAIANMQNKFPHIKMIYYYTQDIYPAIRAMGQKYGLTVGEIGSHAGDMEASIMLYLAPELVKKERLVKGLTKVITPRLRKKFRAEGFNAITENDVVGDQTKALAEKGFDRKRKEVIGHQ